MRFVKKWLNSLSTKVLLAYIVGAAMSICLAAAIIAIISKGDTLSGADVEDSTKEMAKELQYNSDGIPIGFNIDDFDFEWIFESLKQETAYRVLDASGKVVLYSAAGEAFWPDNEAVRRLQSGRF